LESGITQDSKSWDDVLRMAETVNQKMAPKSYGRHMFDPKDRVTPMLDTSEAVEALKIMRDLASPKRANPQNHQLVVPYRVQRRHTQRRSGHGRRLERLGQGRG
jgi:hypothetical protein